MMKYKAFIARDDHDYFLSDLVRLHLAQEGYGGMSYIAGDLTFNGPFPEGTTATAPASGLLLPAGAISVIHDAIHEFQGKVIDGSTEASVLREWLASERERVDRMINR